MYLASSPDSVVYHLELSLNENNDTNTDDVKECSLYGLLGTKGNHDNFPVIFLLQATSKTMVREQRTKLYGRRQSIKRDIITLVASGKKFNVLSQFPSCFCP
jgi:hypothetical protein